MAKVFSYVAAHKATVIVGAIIIAGGGWYGYKKYFTPAAPVRYVLGAVEKGTIVATISGTGQVSSENQFDIKPKVTGDVTVVKVTDGQSVKAGDVLVQINATNAQKSVRDAQSSLESAKLSMEKLQQPVDALSLMQAENSLSSAQEAKQNADDDLKKAYDDAFTDVSDAFLDLPTVMTGLESILYKNTINSYQWDVEAYADLVKQYDDRVEAYKTDAETSQKTARAKFDQNMQDYKAASRTSDNATIEALVAETYDTSIALAEAVKSASNLVDFSTDILTTRNLKVPTQAAGHKTSLGSYTGTMNGHIQTLLSRKQGITNYKNAIVDADRSVSEKTASLAKLKAGTDPLDIQSQQLSLQQKQNALADAKEQLAYYTVRAPFDGIMAKVSVKKGDSAGSAAIGTIIAKQKLAQITLNEVDVSKIKLGQKATLTFDAIDGLSMTGKVSNIDTLGTVTQGVVNYAANIAFDSDDDRVKPGMSVSAAIITDVNTDVLMVPNAAVKTNGGSYVETLVDIPANSETGGAGVISALGPQRVSVETGLANDTNTEITLGLKEGDKVIVRTADPAKTTTTTTQQNGLRLFGGGGRGG
jgi:RND family efflux transporter MFP subunit